MLSRGMHAIGLAECNSWLRGPLFLRESEDAWPKNKVFKTPVGDAELKYSASQGMTSNGPAPEVDHSMRCTFVELAGRMDYPLDPTHYSSWLKLLRIVACVTWFIENCKKNAAVRMTGELAAGELKRFSW